MLCGALHELRGLRRRQPGFPGPACGAHLLLMRALLCLGMVPSAAGTRVPRMELTEMGPRLDLEVRRSRQPPADLEKEACRQPKLDKKKVGRA